MSTNIRDCARKKYIIKLSILFYEAIEGVLKGVCEREGIMKGTQVYIVCASMLGKKHTFYIIS